MHVHICAVRAHNALDAFCHHAAKYEANSSLRPLFGPDPSAAEGFPALGPEAVSTSNPSVRMGKKHPHAGPVGVACSSVAKKFLSQLCLKALLWAEHAKKDHLVSIPQAQGTTCSR